MLNTYNQRYRKIIYSVQGGLVCRPWIQIPKINLQERNISLIPSLGFMRMGYKHYDWHYNWIGTSFGHNLGHAMLQESLACVKRTYV